MDALVFLVSLLTLVQGSPAARSGKVEVVAVAGCLRETAPDIWMLTSATDPVVSNANAPSPKELAAFPKRGTQEFRLTGVSVFNLPAHRGHTVLVKGLLNKTRPTSLLNVTSVSMISAECPAK